MKYKFDHDLHIHTGLSSCSSDPEQSAERLLAYAKENKLSTICVTDHFWDESVPGASDWYAPQNYEHIKKILPLPKSDGIDFLFGCESDMDKNFTVGVSVKRAESFDFMIIPTTHMHMTGFTINENDAEYNEKRAELWVRRFDALLDSALPFKKVGIAHLACPLICKRSREDYLEVISLIPDGEMERLFAKAKGTGIGIELNMTDMSFSDAECDTVLRPFRIAKHQGCKFYLGSDAHHPKAFTRAKDVFERAINLLGLEEIDKYHVG